MDNSENNWKAVLDILQESFIPDTLIQKRVQERLSTLETQSDFVTYLLFILEKTELSSEVRSLAGLLIKNNISHSSQPSSITTEQLTNLKRITLSLLQDRSKEVQGAVTSLISIILMKGGIENWPELIPFLLEQLEKPCLSTKESILSTLLKICEEYLAQDSIELDSTVKLLLTTFVSLVVNENVFVSISGIKIVNEALQKHYVSLKLDFDSGLFLNNLILVANSDNEEIQKYVCQGFVTFLDNQDPAILPRMESIILYMLEKSQHRNEEVSLQATEFWLSCSKIPTSKTILSGYIDRLVPILVKNMRYSENELCALRYSLDNDSHIIDKAEDIRPFQKSETFSGRNNDFQEDIDDFDNCTDEDLLIGWTLRKCSAASLDFLAVLLGDDLLTILLPYLNEILNSEDYITKESGILALGAVAEGCYNSLQQYLPDLIPQLINCMSHEKALIRIITCWTLSRFSAFMISQTCDDSKYIQPTLTVLLRHIIDPNKRVQHAALSAFCIFQEEACFKLIPYLEIIIEGFLQGLRVYQSRSFFLLYDAISVLSQSVGGHLTKYADIILPPLLYQFNYSKYNDHFLAITECLANVVSALDVAFLPYVEATFARCMSVINECLMMILQPLVVESSECDLPDKEPMIGALDLLLAMSVTLKSHIVKYIVNSNLHQQLYYAMQDDLVQIRQAALGLFGDVVRLCLGSIEIQVSDYMSIIIENLDRRCDGVCNNAAWVISKICLATGGVEIKPFLNDILRHFVDILEYSDCGKTMYQTVAISLCTLGLVLPDDVAPFLNSFVRLTCQGLRNRADCEEKDIAFRGLCEMAVRNPAGIANDFIFFCDAAASWNIVNLKPDLGAGIKNILCSFRQHAGEENWTKVYDQFPAMLKQRLSEIYDI